MSLPYLACCRSRRCELSSGDPILSWVSVANKGAAAPIGEVAGGIAAQRRAGNDQRRGGARGARRRGRRRPRWRSQVAGENAVDPRVKPGDDGVSGAAGP
ncbi:hypothetical protein FGO68_gene4073 [Halteria grandinella]|uniref:Uncharacterized protein n=1 Tax=Halteria grandinella TaxID=5974 RepID=A0A8J8N9Y6_HALGN|nr:hypothetical protein FGO68_gene4073 [Halteria grandinella]